jgi:hypothetical protein
MSWDCYPSTDRLNQPNSGKIHLFYTMREVSPQEVFRYDYGVTGEKPMPHLTFDTPARYQIRVRGRISQSWLDRLEGMNVRVETATEDPVICVLEGDLTDQAALLGVLNSLYELHLPVVSVVCLSYPPIIDNSK